MLTQFGDEKTGDEPSALRFPPDLLISLALILTTFAAYWRVLALDFLEYDDPAYVFQNLHLRDAVWLHNLQWIFLSFDPDNWFPVTRLSLLLDYKLFGLRAGPYHAGNLIIHCLAALLLFAWLRGATRLRWPSAFVAFVFALHPLHVESVAWVSERKDVLCAFFWFATLWAWTGYTRRPGVGRYVGALALFSLGLMSKPMIVTLPFLLVLLDVWPLRRGWWGKRIVEKLPFLAASCAVMVVTILAQRNSVQTVALFPLPPRLENALITVVLYIADTLWPARLWVLHAYPQSVPAWQPIMAAAGITTVSVFLLVQVPKRPWLAVGWFWFLLTLIPVIGLVQVGPQARADRYMYVPMMGLAIMLAWGTTELAGKWPGFRRWVAVLGTTVCLAMAAKTSLQTKYWTTSQVLFRHAIDMDSRNYLAWSYLGQSVGLASDAIECYRTGLKIRPGDADLHHNLGNELCHTNHVEAGAAEYREAIRINPVYAQSHASLGNALVALCCGKCRAVPPKDFGICKEPRRSIRTMPRRSAVLVRGC